MEELAGPDCTTTTWMERNKQILGALRMERTVTIITIGLIELREIDLGAVVRGFDEPALRQALIE